MKRTRRNPFKRGALSRRRKGGKYLKSQATLSNVWGKFRSKNKGYADSPRAHTGNTSIGQVPNLHQQQWREPTTQQKQGYPDHWDFGSDIDNLGLGRNGSRVTATSFNHPVNITKTGAQKKQKEGIFSFFQNIINKFFGGK